MQGLPETLAVFESRALSGGVAMSFAIQVDQRKRPGSAAEVFHVEFQAARPLQAHRCHAPD